MSDAPAPSSGWERASLAAALLATDPLIGGVVLCGSAGPAREAWLALLGDLMPSGTPVRRLPPGIASDRLIGGLDLPATLRAGKPVVERGLLAQTEGGVVIVAMAERLPPAMAARIAAAMDGGEVFPERDALAPRSVGRFGVVALDEGRSEDERAPEALIDRLALRIDLDEINWREVARRIWGEAQIRAGRTRLASVSTDDGVIEALVIVAARLGVRSLRAPLQALRVARAFCALRGSEIVEEADVTAAAQLVLGPRATVLPESQAPDREDAADAAEPSAPQEENGESAETDPDRSSEKTKDEELNELVLAATVAAIPTGLLEHIAAGQGRAKSGRAGTAGAKTTSAQRGRPVAARRGVLGEGRLALVDTLRAAAPWQALRRKTPERGDARRLIVKPEDFRIVRFRVREEQTAVFVVDASGSSAAQRLAEVKGAIELLLVDCYVRRDSVALVAFRGISGEIILPPTRSLTRAKRILSGLPGGGATPLASGLDVALALADSLRGKGQRPLLVLMTDGRANIARDGKPGRARALEDALGAATRVRAAGVAALAIDTSPLSQTGAEPPTSRLGQAMGARYVKLPNADAVRVSQAVRAASPGH
jgi:magnesium chelatase subunit D